MSFKNELLRITLKSSTGSIQILLDCRTSCDSAPNHPNTVRIWSNTNPRLLHWWDPHSTHRVIAQIYPLEEWIGNIQKVWRKASTIITFNCKAITVCCIMHANVNWVKLIPFDVQISITKQTSMTNRPAVSKSTSVNDSLKTGWPNSEVPPHGAASSFIFSCCLFWKTLTLKLRPCHSARRPAGYAHSA